MIPQKPLPDFDTLHRFLRYDPDTGKLFWKVKPSQAVPAGAEAGTRDRKGYIRIKLQGVIYMAHRIIWKMVHGEDPEDLVDHRDRYTGNNRITNLREATNERNMWNQRRRSTNTSGVTGVYWSKGKSRWQASICHGGKLRHLGYFDDKQAAIAARAAAKKKHHDLGEDDGPSSEV